MAHPHPEDPTRFWELSHCTLRDVDITNPFWTYCRNFGYGKHPASRNQEEAPSGWITSSGLYEGYVRIPWHDKVAPRVAVPTLCSVCGRKIDKGIEIDLEQQVLGFCTNRHYLEWWITIHNDQSFDPTNYESPAQRFKETYGN